MSHAGLENIFPSIVNMLLVRKFYKNVKIFGEPVLMPDVRYLMLHFLKVYFSQMSGVNRQHGQNCGLYPHQVKTTHCTLYFMDCAHYTMPRKHYGLTIIQCKYLINYSQSGLVYLVFYLCVSVCNYKHKYDTFQTWTTK